MNDCTTRYILPAPLPEGWTWFVWEDVVDGYPKVVIRLRDEKLHCKGHGVIDMFDGDSTAVLDLARNIYHHKVPLDA